MFLEVWQNGKKIEVESIGGDGKVGQTVIFGQQVDWGIDPDLLSTLFLSIPVLPFSLLWKMGRKKRRILCPERC